MLAAPAAMASMNVIDVSGWQSSDVTRVVDADAAVVKITEGTGYTNPYWKTQIDWARSTGKACGGYHYADGGSAVAEADRFVSVFGSYVGQCVLALDWEGGGNAAWGNGAWAQTFVQRVYDRTKVWPIVYVQASAVNQITAYTRKHCMLWKAQYASMNATGWQSLPWNAGSHGEGMVQYSSTGYLNGVGPLDLNLFFGEREAWQKIAVGDRGKTKTEIRKDPVTPKVDTAPDYEAMATKVIRGDYGNGEARRTALGANYTRVMEAVNRRLGLGSAGTASTATATGGGVSAVVRSGDTMSAIAARYNRHPVTAWRVPSGNINLIYPGQTVTYGGTAATTAPAATGGHVVRAGESLWSIYGTGWQAAAQRNGLRSPYTIYPGQRLI
ncbi:LysM peptidoglycan-binding domain-containing protein [Bifidobacterium sp. 64T4]|nr:LysM peptidoglycan-binding domain-containing protein [Bifidobacterium pongonis]